MNGINITRIKLKINSLNFLILVKEMFNLLSQRKEKSCQARQIINLTKRMGEQLVFINITQTTQIQ